MRMTAHIVAIGVLTLVTATAARAQDEATTAPIPRNHVISTSPFLLMFKWFNGDYERKVSPSVTLGVSGSSLLTKGNDDYQRATFHARYYPQGAALTGFYMGAQTGLHRTGNDRRSLGAGLDLGYAWLLGPNRNRSVSIGMGMTRMFKEDRYGNSATIPNVRLLNVGFAF
jgi:uncharacterized protein DUF3575